MAMMCEKRISSGPLLEVDYYPTWENGTKLPTRAPKSKPSTVAQETYNRLCAAKRLIRLVNYNFNRKVDFYGHLTYIPERSPQDEASARRDINNYLRRVGRHRKKEYEKAKKKLREAKEAAQACPGNAMVEDALLTLKKRVRLLKKPLKYCYVMGCDVYKTGKRAGKVNYHFHLFINGGLSAEVLEDLWGEDKARFNLYRPDEFGPDKAAGYMAKNQQQSGKRVAYSKTCKQIPEPKRKPNAATPRQVEKWSKERRDDRGFWERRYKGYRFVKTYPRYNEYNGHWYLSVVMYKTDGDDPPNWEMTAWNTEAGAA